MRWVKSIGFLGQEAGSYSWSMASVSIRVQKWQRRLNWLERYLADNCHLDRNVRELVEHQPFGSVNIAEFSLEKTPRTHGYIYQGVATK